jgi:hypothetical protein
MSSPVLTPPADQFRAVIERSIDIAASAEAVFASVLDDMRAIPDGHGRPMHLKLEAYPGGRWYRDLGHDTGHLWAHVQVIKPPTLLEVFGPLMISSAAISHVAWRVRPQGDGHRLTITHKLFGDFDPAVPANVGGGWQMALDRIHAAALGKTR